MILKGWVVGSSVCDSFWHNCKLHVAILQQIEVKSATT